jgi:hypothetical protein
MGLVVTPGDKGSSKVEGSAARAVLFVKVAMELF